MHGEFVVPADGEHAAGECAVGYGLVEQVVGRFQLMQTSRRERAEATIGFAARCMPSPHFHGSGNGDRNLPGNGDLAKQRAAGGALRDIVGREFGEPGGRVGKALDEIRAAEAGDHGGLSRGEQLIDEGALILGEADVALAVGHAHEEGGDGDVIACSDWAASAC